MTDGFMRRQTLSRANTAASSCQGKVRFLSFTAANVASSRRRHTRKDVDIQEPYRCRHCQGWHLATRA